MTRKLLNTISEVLEEIHKLIGANQTIKIETPVDTPEGQRVLVTYHRGRGMPDGGDSPKRVVFGLDIDNALRRVLAYEDDYEDFLDPERAKKRDKGMNDPQNW